MHRTSGSNGANATAPPAPHSLSEATAGPTVNGRIDRTAPLVLLVEDSATQAAHLAALLETRAGWRVVHAATASDALQSLEGDTPDLVLIDYYLPGTHGDQLCRQMRMRIDMRMTPLVILTGGSGDDLERHGLESGADDFICKSAGDDVLLVRLKALLGRVPERARRADEPTDLRGARLLALHDDRDFRERLAGELARDGLEIALAADGAAAIERIERGEMDCALLSMDMAGLGGLEICRRVMELRRRGVMTPMVLMLAADDSASGLAAALDAGADDFVGASADLSIIRSRVRALLRRRFMEAEHRRRLSADMRAVELEARQAMMEKQAAEARAALVDDLERTAAALRRSNEELQRFAHVASHDLQEPLRMVASYVQLLERRLKGRLDDECREFVGYVVGGVTRMKSLIRDLLAFSRLDTRAGELIPVDCGEILHDALANLRTAMEECGAAVTRDALPIVMGDRSQLMQLFQNLIGNAIKYRSDAPPRIHVAARRDGDHWVISVADNGIGIDPQFFDRVFVIFQRLHAVHEYPGTGIGLAIARKIVERHHGRIWIESKLGAGATFSFTLRAAQGTPDGPQADAPPPAARDAPEARPSCPTSQLVVS